MKLRGDRNQCQGCGEYFNSTSAFDKHRVGDFGVDRRCITNAEMQAKGMVKTDSGFWIGKPMPIAALPESVFRRDQGEGYTQVAP